MPIGFLVILAIIALMILGLFCYAHWFIPEDDAADHVDPLKPKLHAWVTDGEGRKRRLPVYEHVPSPGVIKDVYKYRTPEGPVSLKCTVYTSGAKFDACHAEPIAKNESKSAKKHLATKKTKKLKKKTNKKSL